MPECIYLRNRKESKSRQCGPREGRRWAAKVAPMLQFSRSDHRRRDDSVRCCKSQVHLLKFGNVKGELMATQNIVFPVGSESVKRTLEMGAACTRIESCDAKLDRRQSRHSRTQISRVSTLLKSSGRCWTSRLNLSVYTDPTVNVSISTASHLITWVSVLKSGGRRLSAGAFVHPDDRGAGAKLFRSCSSLRGRPTSWSCGCTRAMEVTAGF